MTSHTSDQTRDKLVRMANQIASFFDTQPGADAGRETADHIRAFWDPSMRAELDRLVRADAAALGPTARAAAAHLSGGAADGMTDDYTDGDLTGSAVSTNEETP